MTKNEALEKLAIYECENERLRRAIDEKDNYLKGAEETICAMQRTMNEKRKEIARLKSKLRLSK